MFGLLCWDALEQHGVGLVIISILAPTAPYSQQVNPTSGLSSSSSTSCSYQSGRPLLPRPSSSPPPSAPFAPPTSTPKSLTTMPSQLRSSRARSLPLVRSFFIFASLRAVACDIGGIGIGIGIALLRRWVRWAVGRGRGSSCGVGLVDEDSATNEGCSLGSEGALVVVSAEDFGWIDWRCRGGGKQRAAKESLSSFFAIFDRSKEAEWLQERDPSSS
jgi:hypothetical protein